MGTQSRTTKTVILSLGKALTSVSGLAATIVLVRLFSKSDFATFRQTLLVFGMVSPFLGMGLGRSVIYFVPTATKKRQGAILLEALGPLLLAGLAYYFFMVFGGSRLAAQIWNNPRLEDSLILFAPIAVLSLTHSILSPGLIATHKVSLAAAIGVISGISVALVSTIFTLFIPEIEITLFSRILVHCAIALLGIAVLVSSFSFEKPTFGGATKQLAFGLPLCFAAAVTVVSKNMDRAMVSALCSLENYAIFDRGAFELPLVAVVTGSMTTILLVDFRTLFEQGRMDEILRLLHRSVEKSALFLMPTMCFLFVLAPELISCMFGEQYLESYKIFQIYLLLLPNRTIVFSAIAVAAGKTKQLAWVSFLALFANFVLSYAAISILGHIGGAISTVVVIYFVSGFLRATIAKNALDCSMAKFLPVATIFRTIGLAMIPLGPVFVCLYVAEDANSFIRLFVSLAVYMTGLMAVYWHQGFVSWSTLQRFLFSRKN